MIHFLSFLYSVCYTQYSTHYRYSGTPRYSELFNFFSPLPFLSSVSFNHPFSTSKKPYNFGFTRGEFESFLFKYSSNLPIILLISSSPSAINTVSSAYAEVHIFPLLPSFTLSITSSKSASSTLSNSGLSGHPTLNCQKLSILPITLTLCSSYYFLHLRY